LCSENKNPKKNSKIKISFWKSNSGMQKKIAEKYSGKGSQKCIFISPFYFMGIFIISH